MLILHTSDWHLGHILYGHDRTAEHDAMLRQITDIVRDRRPDLFVLSGDVFHTSQPSAAVQTRYSEAMVAIHRACPEMTIVVIAGNHDSASRHEIFRAGWLAHNVHAIGTLSRESLADHIIEIPGKGIVVALPYVNEYNRPDDLFANLLAEAESRNSEGLPIVLAAHLTVAGCDFKGHDNGSELTVGGIDAVTLSDIGDGYDYVALGHIHKPQTLHGSHKRARYSGSPVAVSFDEEYAHSVTLVTLEGHGAEPKFEEPPIEIKNPRPLVTIPAAGPAKWDDVLQKLEEYPDDQPALLRLSVEVDTVLPPDAKEIAISKTRGKQCTVCHIAARRPEAVQRHARTMTVEELQQAAPIDIARRYFADKNNPDTSWEELFTEAYNAVINDERQ